MTLKKRGSFVTETIPSGGVQPSEGPQVPARLPGAEDSQAGTSIGRYIPLYPVGQGGMGEVFAAYDPTLDRKVALKVLRPYGAEGQGSPLAPLEAKAMAQLNHPCVVTVHDSGVHEGRPYLAMEFVDGISLREWLVLHEPTSWRAVLPLLIQAGQGLAAAHQEGLVHGDFKPSNVLVSEEGRALVSDFGLATFANPEDSGPATAAGTPGFLAPEQQEGGGPSHRTDQYSFGVTCFFALTGQLPPAKPGSEAGREEAHAILSRSAIPTWIRRSLLKALSTRPEERFPDLGALLQALDPARRRWWWRATAAALALTVLIALWWTTAVRSLPECPAPVLDPATTWKSGPSTDPESRALDIWMAAYLGRWKEERQATCDATFQERTQSERVLDLRLFCLDARLQEFASVAAALEPRAEPPPSPFRLLESLGDLDSCRDPSRLASVLPPPQDPEKRRRIYTLQSRLFALRQRAMLDETLDLEALQRNVEEVVEVDYPATAAEGYLTLALSHQYQDSDFETALQFLEKALWESIKAKDPLQQGKIYAHLVENRLLGANDLEGAGQWGQFARAALYGFTPAQSEAYFPLLSALAHLAWFSGDYQGAVDLSRQLVEEETQDPGLVPTHRARHLSNMAIFLLDLPDREGEARDYLEQALALRIAIHGEGHPQVAHTLGEIAALHGEEEDFAAAERTSRQALDILSTHHPPEHPSRIVPTLNWIASLLALDRPASVGPALEELEPILRGTFGDHHFLTAHLWQFQGDYHFQMRRYGEARKAFSRAQQLREGLLPEGHPDRLSTLLGLARTDLAQGRHGNARRRLEGIPPDRWNALKPRQEALARLLQGEALAQQGETEAAANILAPLFEGGEEVTTPPHPFLAAEALYLHARYGLPGIPENTATARALQWLQPGQSPRSQQLRDELHRLQRVAASES